MRRILSLLLVAAFVAPCFAAQATPVSLIDADAAWLLSVQTADGAITMSYEKTWIQPYFANIGARGLARAYAVTSNALYRDAAMSWLMWYQAHMDPQTGYVTDYRLINGSWTSGEFVAGHFVTGFYDSTDSYAATFLTAAEELRRASGENTLIQQLRPGINLAMKAMHSTTDARDGLTYASPTYPIKYAMDNAEVFEGWIAASSLAHALGDAAAATMVGSHAQHILTSLGHFYNGAAQAYDWAMDSRGVHSESDWAQFYPTATAQAWIVNAQLIDGQSARTLMTRFDSAQPNWDDPQTKSSIVDRSEEIGYHPGVALAFLRAGLRSRARTAWANFEASATSTLRLYPYHPGAAGTLILLGADDRFLDADDPA